MKALLLFISLVLTPIITKCQITRQEAINTIVDEVVGIDSLEIHNLYSRYEKMYQNDTLWLDGFFEYYLAPYEENWIFFVDLMPQANWAHGCQIIFFDASNGEYAVNDDDWPPDPFLGGMTQFFEEWEWILSVGTSGIRIDNTVFQIFQTLTGNVLLKFKNQNSGSFTIDLIDITGRIINTEEYQTGYSPNGSIELNVNGLNKGVFLARVSTKGKVLFTGKFLM